MWKNMVQPDWPQITIRLMRSSCWIPKATNTFSDYMIFIDFTLQQYLLERYTYRACLVMVKIRSQVFMQYAPTSMVARDLHFRFPYLAFRPPPNVISLCLYFCWLYVFWRILSLWRQNSLWLARSQYSEGPATGHLDTGFSRFPCAYKQMLRWFPRFQVATTCFLCSPPDLNLVATNYMFCLHVK